MKSDEDIFQQTELDDISERIPGDPLTDYADRIIGAMKEIMPPLPLTIPHAFTPPELENKVRIFHFSDEVTFNPALLNDIERDIQKLLNDGWHCTHSDTCNDVMVMSFTRPKWRTQNEN